jgi:hypothetical protein
MNRRTDREAVPELLARHLSRVIAQQDESSRELIS